MHTIAQCQATAIGSFPHDNADDVVRIITECIPRIPVWPQLPFYSEEGMTRQYNEGMPGLTAQDDRIFFDTLQPTFEADLLTFFEDYLEALELSEMPVDHRFGISPRCARGFYALKETLASRRDNLVAVKGQITGPITLATTLTDQNRRSAYYDPQLREVVVKTLALKAKWQVHQLRSLGVPVVVFIDEPSLAAYGSSAFLGISEADVINDLREIIDQIHAEGGIAGIHCCENTDWGMLMRTGIDILNFDAYGFFDRVVLYAKELKYFINQGKVLAWGLVPTGNQEDIRRETASSLLERWETCLQGLIGIGIERARAIQQSLLTPSCGTGSLTPELSQRVMHLLKDLSELVRRVYL
ncbi:MAG: hypothetical protein JXD19_10265 [Deltaproteobacteria bacterium]|nr:hypothetical protein [Deltaproteobacteria bacterium]